VKPSWIEPDWPIPAGVRALSSFRGGGASSVPYASLNLGGHVGDTAAAVAENRRRLAVAAGLPSEPVWLAQVHGVNVADLDALDALDALEPIGTGGAVGVNGRFAASAAGALPPADAAFTRQPGRVCAILTADCLPVLLTADSGDLVAAVHAGWRGLAGGVIEAAVRALGIAPERLLAWLGPAIGPRHFEVGAEVREALLQGDPGAGDAFVPNSKGRFMADLAALARRRLASLGVGRLYGAGHCTFADAERYFSHRRDGVTGRQATLIWLQPQSGLTQGG